jgi:uroporphyrinogen-III synthase
MALTWLITRPLDEALPLVEALKARGVPAHALPCIERLPRPFPEWPPAEATTPVLLVTSGALVPQVAERWPHLAARGVVVAAMAPSTSAKLRSLGVPVAVEAKGGVAKLVQALSTFPRGPSGRLDVLYPTSDAALQQPEHLEAIDALKRFALVRVETAYSVQPAPTLDEQLRGVEGEVGVFLASPSAVEAFVGACARSGRPPPRDAVLHGRSTLRAWKSNAPLNWPTPRLQGALDDLATTLLSQGATP